MRASNRVLPLIIHSHLVLRSQTPTKPQSIRYRALFVPSASNEVLSPILPAFGERSAGLELFLRASGCPASTARSSGHAARRPSFRAQCRKTSASCRPSSLLVRVYHSSPAL